jgi:hypothetical protein
MTPLEDATLKSEMERFEREIWIRRSFQSGISSPQPRY